MDGADFVDLPGYGYAKVSKSEKGRWSELIEGYFNQARVFALVVALVDIRHEATPLDVHMIDFLRESGLPFAVVLTKADKLSKQQIMKQTRRHPQTVAASEGRAVPGHVGRKGHRH